MQLVLLIVASPTPLNTIPAKILIETNDICSQYLKDIFNSSLENNYFPPNLKMADISPAHKRDETTNKENYRPISIWPAVSKMFEKIMYDQIEIYMNIHLSDYLCGYRKGYSTQYCLLSMLEKWKKALDKHHVAGGLLTDLSKAFDCLNHFFFLMDFSFLEQNTEPWLGREIEPKPRQILEKLQHITLIKKKKLIQNTQ